MISRLLPVWLCLLMISGCSSLPKNIDTESAIASGFMGYAAISETSGGEIPNYGTTHAIISYGASEAVGTFADSVFPAPEDEWLADTVAIIGGILPAAYYHDKEKKDSADSEADWVLPLGNMLRVVWKRLGAVQE